MHRILERKATIVTYTEHSPKTLRGDASCFAMPRDRMGIRGRVTFVLGSAASVGAFVAIALLLTASSAFATKPPHVSIGATEIHATRANISASVTTFESEAVSYRLEYATSEGALAEGKGVLFRSGSAQAGEVTGSQGSELRGLAPETRYYARVVAENASDHVEATVGFTTSGPEAPEIHTVGAVESEDFAPSPFEIGQTFAVFFAEIDTNAAETEYHFEYATEVNGPYKPFTSGASGSISIAEEFAKPRAKLSGLTPDTTYYVRVTATNGHEPAASYATWLTTRPTYPEASIASVKDVAGTSAHIWGSVVPRSSEAHWRFEYAPAEDGNAPAGDSPAWTRGPSGVISSAEANEGNHSPEGELTGLDPATRYYVRLFVENGHEPAATSSSVNFQTAGAPVAFTFAAHAFAPGGETMRLVGSVAPHTEPINELQKITLGGSPTGGSFTLSFNGQTTAPLPFDATRDELGAALEALSTIGGGNVRVASQASGPPFTIEFTGSLGGGPQPSIAADASGLTPAGTVTVSTVQAGFSYDTQAHFEYVSQQRFEETGWTGAQSSAAHDVGPGSYHAQVEADASTYTFGVDASGLTPGETYRYRLVAANTTPGDPEVDGAEQALTVPVPARSVPAGPCPNEALRTGPSAQLPDCRAYEQVTPTEKEGSGDIFGYTGSVATAALIGEDGDHVMVEPKFSKWGSDVDANVDSYFFAREAGTGWRMTGTTPQPQAGADSYQTEIFSPDLTQVGLQVGWASSAQALSPDIEMEAGPPGGPYTTVATVPRKFPSKWVAASADFSTLVLLTEDRVLVAGHPSKTTSGTDLYEYSARSGLRQVNVLTGGEKISSCGAEIANSRSPDASVAAVSADGSRVLFTDNCTHNLYMRTDGTETIEIGEYIVLATNAQDTELLLSRGAEGAEEEVFLYDTGTRTAKLLPGARRGWVSEDLSTIYFASKEQLTPDAPAPSPASEYAGPLVANLYRYDVTTGHLGFTGVQGGAEGSVSAEGRYLYFVSVGVAGVFREIEQFRPGEGTDDEDQQLYRYDSVEHSVECLSCASPFRPRPEAPVVLADRTGGNGNVRHTPNSVPEVPVVSADGDFVFFDTATPLVPQDVDGEIHPCQGGGGGCGVGAELGNHNNDYTTSSDVYEWRKNGVDGCSNTQGCLALITSGTGGLMNVLLGTDASGRDVFFATHSQLVAGDTDEQGDVYDARIGGGFPVPARPSVECEGDSCSTPLASPDDLTPASATFQGAGNVLPGTPAETKSKTLKPKRSKSKKRPKRKSRAKSKRKARKSDHRRAK